MVSHASRSDHGEDASDDVLLSGIALGEEWAGLAFVRRYQHRLFGLAFGILGDARLAEEVAQEAFIRIFTHAEVFDALRGSASTWALTITRNLAIDVLRVQREIPTDPVDPVFLRLLNTECLREDAASLQDQIARVQTALAGLPFEQRRAVLLAGMYGRSASEIARTDAIPLGTAKSRIRAGMAKLRGALEVATQ
jgi:RNA polymerase sigma factor (sigma-70 family)